MAENNHDELDCEEMDELIAHLEHAIGELDFVAHCSANALGRIRFKTKKNQVFEINLSYLDQFPNWESRDRISF